jgi:nicotinamidase-related amidase
MLDGPATTSAAGGYPAPMSDTALLVIDMFNAYDHPDAEQLAANVVGIVDPLSELLARVHDRDDVDLIYVNDNYGDFTADHRAIIRAALDGAHPDLVKPMVPDPDCRFLTKVRHSVFYATPLDYLLSRLGTRRLILAGQVTEQCILYSALDGYIRHFEVVVPPDAVAHIDADLGKSALAMMRRNMRAELLPSADCLR